MGSLGKGVFLEVAEEQEGGMRMPYQVYVLGLEDRGARGLVRDVADVSDGDLDGACSGGGSFA